MKSGDPPSRVDSIDIPPGGTAAATVTFLMGSAEFTTGGSSNIRFVVEIAADGVPRIQRVILPTSYQKTVPLSYIDVQYVANFNNDRILVGSSQNIFVGKVIRQVDGFSTSVLPHTKFEVEVVASIKGALDGVVVVEQMGGYKGNKLYVVSGGNAFLPNSKGEGAYMLQPGVTYLLATRHINSGDPYRLISHPAARMTISTEIALDYTQLRAMAENDPRVKQLQAAYPNEILLPVDVLHNSTRNSYQSLTEEQKAALPYYQPPQPPQPPPPPPAPTSTGQ